MFVSLTRPVLLCAAGCGPPSVGDSCSLTYRDDGDRGFTEPDCKDSGAGAPPHILGPPPTVGPFQTLRVSEPERTSSPTEHRDSCGPVRDPNPAPKPKLWSLAEIATSADRSKGSNDSSQGGASTPRTPFSHSPALPRHLYYASPFIPGYSSYGPLAPLHGPGSPLHGLQQTMLQRAEAAARDCRLLGPSQLELHELKRGMTNV